MIRSRFKSLAVTLPFFPFGGDPDSVGKDTQTVKDADFSSVKNESGWDRLCDLFTKNDFGEISPELHAIIEVSCMSSFVGALYGGIVSSRESYLEFMKSNEATIFKNHYDAKKKLQDQVTLSFAKGAFKWGWRLTFFTTMYITTASCLAAYRGKNGILEHTTAGLLAGTLYKFKMGPRGWIVGGGLGLVLGTFAGVLTSSLLKLSGMTMEEVRYWNYKWADSRSESFNKRLREHLDEERIQLLKDKEAQVGNIDNTLDHIPNT